MKIFCSPILLCILLLSCKSKTQQNIEDVSTTQSSNEEINGNELETYDGYEDGDYCATIQYYNSSTGNSSTYTLEVEVENGELVRINWTNGGWLDSSHFNPPEVDSDGSCSFTTFDGKDYDVQIEGAGACGYSNSSPEEDDEEVIESEEVEEEIFEESISQNQIQRDQLFTGINKVFWKMKNFYE